MKWVTKIVLKIFTVFDERCNLQEIYEIRCMTLRGHLQDPRQGNPRLFKSLYKSSGTTRLSRCSISTTICEKRGTVKNFARYDN